MGKFTGTAIMPTFTKIQTAIWLILVLTAAMASGCRERQHWTKPQADQSQSDLDHAACRNLATKRANREYQAELSIREATDTGGGSVSETLVKLDAEKRERELYQACLSRLGYQATTVK